MVVISCEIGSKIDVMFDQILGQLSCILEVNIFIVGSVEKRISMILKVFPILQRRAFFVSILNEEGSENIINLLRFKWLDR